MKFCSFLLLGISFLTLPILTLAATPDSIQTLSEMLITFFNTVLVPFLFSLALLIFIYNVVKYFIIDPVGNSGYLNSREEARTYALYSVIGFVLMVILWGIVNLFVYGLGFDRSEVVCPDFLPEFYCQGLGLQTQSNLPPSTFDFSDVDLLSNDINLNPNTGDVPIPRPRPSLDDVFPEDMGASGTGDVPIPRPRPEDMGGTTTDNPPIPPPKPDSPTNVKKTLGQILFPGMDPDFGTTTADFEYGPSGTIRFETGRFAPERNNTSSGVPDSRPDSQVGSCQQHFATVLNAAINQSRKKAYVFYQDFSGDHRLSDVTTATTNSSQLYDLDKVRATLKAGNNHRLAHTYPAQIYGSIKSPTAFDYLSLCRQQTEFNLGIDTNLAFDSQGAWEYAINRSDCPAVKSAEEVRFYTNMHVLEACHALGSLDSNQEREQQLRDVLDKLDDPDFISRLQKGSNVDISRLQNSLTDLDGPPYAASTFQGCAMNILNQYNIFLKRVTANNYCALD